MTAALPGPAQHVAELIPYDAAAREVLELTLREAVRLGHDVIGTEHILLALLERPHGVPAGLGIDKAAAEAHIVESLAAS